MSSTSRILTALGSLLLIGLFLFPMWSIRLEAPQYPGDSALGILIHINKVEGAKPNDLDNINGLNHYIGMKAIEPDQIAELRYMPLIVAALIATGLLVALVGRRGPLFAWFGVFTLAALAGLADFWRWEYDYGHDLDPTAAIKIPGMAYQPPLLGGKQLLNFHASSWPDIGGIAAIVSRGTQSAANGASPKFSTMTASKPALASVRASSTARRIVAAIGPALDARPTHQ